MELSHRSLSSPRFFIFILSLDGCEECDAAEAEAEAAEVAAATAAAIDVLEVFMLMATPRGCECLRSDGGAAAEAAVS